MAASKGAAKPRTKTTAKKTTAKRSTTAKKPVPDGTTRKGTDAPKVKADEPQKVGDASVRVSLKPSDAQPGPNAQSEGKTTDTRGSTEGTRTAKDTPLPANKPGTEQTPTAAETAAKQPIRQTDLPTVSEIHEVSGEKVEVYADPGLVDPVELPPHKRDTLVKDQLRHEGEEGRRLADAPVKNPEGGDWQPEADKRTPNDL